jgi:hypothetical protein
LKNTLTAKNLNADDGDHGVGMWKRKPQFTKGIKDIIHNNVTASHQTLNINENLSY